MIARICTGILPLFLGCALALSSRAADSNNPALDGRTATPETERQPPVFHPVSPGPTDGRVAFVTAAMLEQMHYTRMKFDETVSSNFFDRYFESLENTVGAQHAIFLQPDIEEFEHYRDSLGRLTLRRQGTADTKPACEIFNRFIERLQQREAYIEDVLKNERFDFNTDERVLLNRHDTPRPADIDQARKLWRERLEFEYLQEKLAKDTAKTKPDTAAKPETKDKTTAATTRETKPKSEHEEIVDTLNRRYLRILHSLAEWNSQDVLEVYLNALAHVYDPHSDYMGPATVDSFAITMNLSLFGIGAELRSEDGYCNIFHLLPGGPAAKSKMIKEKDRIIAVAQSNSPPVDIVDMRLDRAVQLIRGPKGTEVRLTVLPDGAGAPVVVSLIRDEIKLEDYEAKSKIIELPDSHGENVRLGVIDLPSFYAHFDPNNQREDAEPKSTTADVAKLLTKMKNEHVNGVVLDLRRNGGGSLDEAIKLTGLFVKEEPVVQVRDFAGNVQVDDSPEPSVLYDGPLIVLTSRGSASASEIVAGALQDYGRALVVGESSTHGKGTVQAVNPLRPAMRMSDSVLTNDPGALKLTIKKFYRASGASTQLKGVIPDIVLPSKWNDDKEIGEAALESPLPWDTISSAKFDHLDRVTPYLSELSRRSTERMATDKEFEYVREDIALFKKQQEDKTLSLSEKYWLKQKAEDEAREKARDKERAARKETPEIVYDLTVKQSELAGLPSPVERTNTAALKLSSRPLAHAGLSATNSAAVEAARNPLHPGGVLDDALDTDKPAPVDVDLAETEHILVDYLSLLSKDRGLTAGHLPPAP